jgi:hypothetical protein
MAVAIVCPFCGFSKKTSDQMIPERARWAICPRCRRKFELPQSEKETRAAIRDMGHEVLSNDAGDESQPGSERQGSPWEARSEYGFVRGAWETFKASVFSPATFFRGLTVNGGLREPLAFGLLMGAIGNMFSLFWPVILVSGGLFPFGEAVLSQLDAALVFLILLVVVPVCVTIGMVIYSAILHVLLLVVRGGKNGFEATFRVVAYSQAVQMWELVPVIGSWIGGVWRLVVQVIGLREIHGVSYSRVIIAFILPLAFLVILMVAVVIPFILLLAR